MARSSFGLPMAYADELQGLHDSLDEFAKETPEAYQKLIDNGEGDRLVVDAIMSDTMTKIADLKARVTALQKPLVGLGAEEGGSYAPRRVPKVPLQLKIPRLSTDPPQDGGSSASAKLPVSPSSHPFTVKCPPHVPSFPVKPRELKRRGNHKDPVIQELISCWSAFEASYYPTLDGGLHVHWKKRLCEVVHINLRKVLHVPARDKLTQGDALNAFKRLNLSGSTSTSYPYPPLPTNPFLSF